MLSANNFRGKVDAVLLDAWSQKALGGTGSRLPIEWLRNCDINIPWWLAGGISAESVHEILQSTKPFGLDASSNLEDLPGVKNIELVSSLIKEVKAFNKECT